MYRFCNTNTLRLPVKTAKFRTDDRFTTVDVQATFHIQRVAMLKHRFQAKFCIPSPKSSSSPSHKALKKFSTRLPSCHFMFWGEKKNCLITQIERICMLCYRTSFHDSKVSDANVLPNLQVREATTLLLLIIYVIIAATLIFINQTVEGHMIE